jgi:hypothetical protein
MTEEGKCNKDGILKGTSLRFLDMTGQAIFFWDLYTICTGPGQ